MKSSKKILNQLTKTIVDQVHPLRIVLFGSRARGTAGPDSDIDLMILMPNGTHRRHTAQKLRREIQGIGAPYDLVVATPFDLERYGNSPGLIYRDILREGKVVYDA